MKIQELRKRLSEANKDLVEKAFVESYKSFSKSQKEEIDDVIIDILEGKDTTNGKAKKTINFENLEQEIDTFLENAYAQNYFAPNRIIPKNQRSKWRFLVKNYIKELTKIPDDSEYYSRMVRLLGNLYRMLCYGCNSYIFSTDDPFRSIGWNQSDLFQILIKKTFYLGYTKESMKKLLLDAVSGGLSTECLHQFNMFTLLAELKTSDVKYMAIETAKELVIEKKSKLKPKKSFYYSEYYYQNETIDNLCKMVLILYVALAEGDEGIEYFFQNCLESNKEIVLYMALDLLDDMEEDKYWIQTYEYGLKKKIKPRKELVETYKLKKEQEKTT